MTPIDVIEVIKACKAADVSKLKLGELELEFKTGEAVKTPISVAGETVVEIPSAKQLKEIEEHSRLTENVNDAEEELAHMQVEDPAQFESLLVERELVDDGSRSEQNA